ncbi:very short patch repair endonuclease [Nitratireductor sp. XY-223]|uniref:very short patch repair endonuclease n=1 Tax=Nitratireductor sp. XY-223 TaxID=2561926 RepID=UPI0010A9F339|nr:very short patch repair endonuclease [Nitratireductor sp. XY-223]
MPDIVDQKTRSRMMSGIRAKNTKPEMMFRRALHGLGFRYRLHARNVPGKPDMVFPKYCAVFLIHGCFWHGHDCRLFRLPDTRREFWRQKIERNRQRDAEVRSMLDDAGWRHLTIWECSVRGKESMGFQRALEEATRWLTGGTTSAEIRGAP